MLNSLAGRWLAGRWLAGRAAWVTVLLPVSCAFSL